jgi:hypothetical protein
MHPDFHFLKTHVPPAYLPRFIQATTRECQKTDEGRTVTRFARAAGFDCGKDGVKLIMFRQFKFLLFHAKSFNFSRWVFIMTDSRTF